MPKNDLVKAISVVVLLVLAGLLTWRSFFGAATPGETAFFYDVSAGRLFAGPATAVPPIAGIDGGEPDGMRAMVVSTTGKPEDRDSWQVVYLERYSPELKRQMEEAQATGGSPSIGRGAAQAHRFIRRLDESAWHPMNSPEAETILGAWLTAGPGGGPATVCTP
ncbi:MAG: hypothetical protein KDM81_02165 [Verrucomicrobiae bacterium]|nr:hypothetical protein [Verrucomicrobiae bacterium]MCP5523023.1 hypothetical protein [Verrucomicrobiales bacterium]